MVGLDLARDWEILSAARGDPTAGLAAHELQQILQRIGGRPIPLVAQARLEAPLFRLSYGQGEKDGFVWRIGPSEVHIDGDTPRGLLYAVYSLLEALGCRWVAPGKAGERLPSATLFSLAAEEAREAPHLPGRCLVIGHHAFLRDVDDWIVWAGRNRLNTLFIHATDESLALGAVSARHWQFRKDAALALARERGMTVEYGGHGLAGLLPRRLFRTVPQAFRFDGTRRTPDHNLCPSSVEARDILQRNAAAHFRAYPEADVFHLWADDIPGGGWCACPACREFTPSEQSLMATNAAAEALESVNPKAVLSFLAYHDTEATPARVAPRRNVALLWAPRMRCYAHAADDPACPANTPHYPVTLEKQIAHFAGARAAPTRVFEYYLDAILFKSLLPPLPSVIQSDLRFYRRAGVHTVQALMTGPRPWVVPELNAWLFSRLAWNPDQPVEPLLRDFCHSAFGDQGADLLGYYRALEAAYALALDIAPEQRHLASGGFWESPRNPPTDMGDPALAPAEVLLRKAHDNLAIEEWVRRAGRHLEAARAASYPAAWEAERTSYHLHHAWLSFDLARVQLLAASQSGLGAPGAKTLLQEAYRQLGLVSAWGRTHVLDRRHRAHFRLQHHYFWRLRLNQIRGRYFAGRLRRFLIRTADFIRLVWYALQLRHAFDRD